MQAKQVESENRRGGRHRFTTSTLEFQSPLSNEIE